jgi:hypothetical protein
LFVQVKHPPSADTFAWHCDAVKGAEPFDPSHQPSALVHKAFAFSAEALGVFLFDTRDTNLSRHRSVTTKPRPEDARHLLCVQAVSLRPAATTRLQETGRVEHYCPNAGPQEETSQPKAIISDLVTNSELQWAAETGFCSNAPPTEPFYQTLVITRLDRVQAGFLATLRRCKSTQPFRLAELKGNAAYVLHFRHGDLRLLCRKISGNFAAAPRQHRIYFDCDLQ